MCMIVCIAVGTTFALIFAICALTIGAVNIHRCEYQIPIWLIAYGISTIAIVLANTIRTCTNPTGHTVVEDKARSRRVTAIIASIIVGHLFFAITGEAFAVHIIAS